MEKFYTADYTGEMVSANVSWRDRNNPDSMTWVEKTILNEYHSSIAHVIGNSKSRKGFNLEFLKGQVGGAGGVRSVGQSYGCNLLYKDFNPTFLICTNVDICKDIAESGYCEDNIVYSNVKNILQHPGYFHLYPHMFPANTGALALRLACADGHKTVYMIGMTGYDLDDDNIYIGEHERYAPVQDKLATTQKFTIGNCSVIETYDDVQFYYVVRDIGLMPDSYKWFRNVQEISYRQYINLAGLGAIAH